MRKKIVFENGVQEIQINHDGGFKQLHLISANIKTVEDMKVIPSVELILSNDKAMFRSYSNVIPGSNNLNCFDILLTAINNPTLSNEIFHTLKCVVTGNDDDVDMVFNMEFEIE